METDSTAAATAAFPVAGLSPILLAIQWAMFPSGIFSSRNARELVPLRVPTFSIRAEPMPFGRISYPIAASETSLPKNRVRNARKDRFVRTMRSLLSSISRTLMGTVSK